MVKGNLSKILSDNGFINHPHPAAYCNTYVVDNIELINTNQKILYIDIAWIYDEFIIYINVEDDINISNLCINLDMYTQIVNLSRNKILRCGFKNENDLINELHRLNLTGFNIKRHINITSS